MLSGDLTCGRRDQGRERCARGFEVPSCRHDPLPPLPSPSDVRAQRPAHQTPRNVRTRPMTSSGFSRWTEWLACGTTWSSGSGPPPRAMQRLISLDCSGGQIQSCDVRDEGRGGSGDQPKERCSSARLQRRRGRGAHLLADDEQHPDALLADDAQALAIVEEFLTLGVERVVRLRARVGADGRRERPVRVVRLGVERADGEHLAGGRVHTRVGVSALLRLKGPRLRDGVGRGDAR